jgi:aspartate/methionine/tyrosine aminotransferase
MPTSAPTQAPAFTRLAHRLDNVGFSDIVLVRNKVMALRAAGKVVWGLHGGEPFFDTPEVIKHAMTQALVENKTRYAPSSGIEPLREAIAKKLVERNKMPAAVENVIVTSGGVGALFAAFQTVLDPGDEVLVFSPYWTPIHDMITGTQAVPVLVPTTEARREGLTESMERHRTAKTRAIYYNTPQNPSGAVFHREDAKAVADFAHKHDLVVIADEAYEDLVYDGEHVSIASLPGMMERTISTYTLSKTYGMTGWRLGYAVATEPFMTGLKKMVLYSINGVSTPTQWAGVAAMHMPVEFMKARLEDYRKRREVLLNGLAELGLECEKPEGAFYAFPRVDRIAANSRDAASILLDKAHVATVPGSVFGVHGEGHLRMGYATTLEQIEGALDAMRKAGI